MNNKKKNIGLRQAIKGIGAVALGSPVLAASSWKRKNEKDDENKNKKSLMEKQLSLQVEHVVLVWQC